MPAKRRKMLEENKQLQEPLDQNGNSAKIQTQMKGHPLSPDKKYTFDDPIMVTYLCQQ
jgi:hypothetical protein